MKKNGTTKINPENCMRMPSPVGTIVLVAKDNAITALRLAREQDEGLPSKATEDSVLYIAAKELGEYFAGKRKEFSFAMLPVGTSFQQRVWQALLRIPYGETRSYGEIALQVGVPNGARAVGGACNKNPIWIAVPCHRVVGASGALTGYAYGTGMKKKLLTLEFENKIKHPCK